jgi:hypothetical protein
LWRSKAENAAPTAGGACPSRAITPIAERIVTCAS